MVLKRISFYNFIISTLGVKYVGLPVNQISKSQSRSSVFDIQPNAEVMQRNFSSQTRLKSCQTVGPLLKESEGIVQLVIDGFYNLK